MKSRSCIARGYTCVLVFPFCVTLHASTIATITANASYEAPVGGFKIPCSQTSQTDPASVSCVLNSPAFPQVSYRASATAADGDIA